MKLGRIALAAVVFVTGTVFAVSTQYFQDSQGTDFKAGKTENLVISNNGTLGLGLQISKLLESRTDVSTIFDVRILSDGSIIAASGPEGLLLTYKNKKWETLYKVDQPYIFSIELGKDGVIYAGTGGSAGKVIEIKPGAKSGKVLFENKDAQYVWSLKQLPNGKLVAATGPKGKVFLIDASGAKEIFSCKQKNVQTLAVGRDGAIYAGTDTDAIVYKIEPRGEKYAARALYDATEEEISALAIDEKGIVYAATASSNTASDQAKSYLSKPSGTPTTTSSMPTTTSSAPAGKAVKSESETPMGPGPGGPGAMRFPGMMPPGGGPGPMSMPAGPSGKGNTVYRIDALGFVTEVFRDQVNINSMIVHDGKLYLGTGPDGYVFTVNPATEDVTLSAKTGAGYVNSVRLTTDGSLLLGTGNPGQVVRLGPALAKTGTFTSKVFDASQISRWGTIDITLADSVSPDVKGLTVQTRSSVVANPEDTGWSEWSKPVDAGKAIQIPSPSARYIQYRLTFEAKGTLSPAIRKVQIAYMQDNRKPEIASVTINTGQTDKRPPVEPSEGPDGESEGPPPPMMPPKMTAPKSFRLTWKASDPNGDQLRYNIYLRPVGTPYWTLLEKDFQQPSLTWDPRTVPDGKFEVKVVANDKLANPVGMELSEARVSDPFIVDNTPPAIKNLTAKLVAPGKLLVQAELSDEWSEIANAWVVINGGKDWQYVAPADELYDSKTERIETTIPVKPINGPIMLTVKVADRANNTGFAWLVVPQTPNTKDAPDSVQQDE